MELYIKHNDFITIDHPVTKQNLEYIYPGASIPEGIGQEWKKFVRIDKPISDIEGKDFVHNGYKYNPEDDFFFDEWIEIDVEVTPVEQPVVDND